MTKTYGQSQTSARLGAALRAATAFHYLLEHQAKGSLVDPERGGDPRDNPGYLAAFADLQAARSPHRSGPRLLANVSLVKNLGSNFRLWLASFGLNSSVRSHFSSFGIGIDPTRQDVVIVQRDGHVSVDRIEVPTTTGTDLQNVFTDQKAYGRIVRIPTQGMAALNLVLHKNGFRILWEPIEVADVSTSAPSKAELRSEHAAHPRGSRQDDG